MNKEQTDWQPESELLAWAKQHFESIPVNGVWSPDSTGVQYMKTDEKTWLLMSMYEHPDSKDYHNKMLVLMNAVGYEVATPDGFETITPPLDPSHQAEMHYQQKQELAMGWKCDCGEHLANFELENRTDEYVETIEAQLDNGQSAPLQLWRCHITCPTCETNIPMEPDDYHVLAGDELFMQFTNMKVNNLRSLYFYIRRYFPFILMLKQKKLNQIFLLNDEDSANFLNNRYNTKIFNNE